MSRIRTSTSQENKTKQTKAYNQLQIFNITMLQKDQQSIEQDIKTTSRNNPAIEVEEKELCPICNRPYQGSLGDRCECAVSASNSSDSVSDSYESAFEASYSGNSGNVADDTDPFARVSGVDSFCAGLKTALRAEYHKDMYPVIDYLIDNLNSQGYLPEDIVEETCDICSASEEDVTKILTSLQMLDPAGIGARSFRESLLLQLLRITPRHVVAEALIQDHFEDFAERRYREIAKALNVPQKIVENESQFIRDHLSPKPAHGFDPDLNNISEPAPTIRPDVVIRKTSQGMEVDVVESRRFKISVAESYTVIRKQMRKNSLNASEQERTLIRDSVDEANNFINAIHHRWQTIKHVCEALVTLQNEYLEHGTVGLRKLTRKDVGHQVGLHESTVSRATAGKFVLLPNGKTVPFDDFFDDSQYVKDKMREFIENEDPRHPLSDEQLMRLINRCGMDIARRTVAKYRDELKILPSRFRRSRATVHYPST